MKLVKKIVKGIRFTIREHRAPRWFAEPVRTIANRVVAGTVIVGSVTASAVAFTDLVPEKYRKEVIAVVAGIVAVNSFVAKWAAKVARAKVFSPATYYADVTTARRKPETAVAPQVPMP